MQIPANVAQWLDAYYKKLDAMHKELIQIRLLMTVEEEEEEKQKTELRLIKEKRSPLNLK